MPYRGQKRHFIPLLLLLFVITPDFAAAEDGFFRRSWNSIALPVNGWFFKQATGSDCSEEKSLQQLEPSLAYRIANCTPEERNSFLQLQETANQAVESALLNKMAMDRASQLKCESSYMNEFDKNPRNELRDFCSGRTSEVDANNTKLSKQTRNQIAVLKSTFGSMETARDIKRRLQKYYPVVFDQIQRGQEPTLPELTQTVNIENLKCEEWLSLDPGQRRKAQRVDPRASTQGGFPRENRELYRNACLHIYADALNVANVSTWNYGNPRMREFMKRAERIPNWTEENFLRHGLCSTNSLHELVISATREQSDEERQKINNIKGDFANNSWFARQVIQEGRHEQYLSLAEFKDTLYTLQTKNGETITGYHYAENDSVISVRLPSGELRRLQKADLVPATIPDDPRFYAMAACRLDAKFGSGSEIASGVVDLVTLAGVGAGLVIKAATKGALAASRLSQAGLRIQQGTTLINTALVSTQAADAADSCTRTLTPTLKAAVCNSDRPLSDEESFQANYQEINSSQCLMNVALTSLGVIGVKMDVSDAFVGVTRNFQSLMNRLTGRNFADDLATSNAAADATSGGLRGVTDESTAGATTAGRQLDSGELPRVNGTPVTSTGQIKSLFLRSSPITPRDINYYIRIARSGLAKRFFVVENAILKELNDILLKGDFDLATSLTNAYKHIIHEEMMKSPLLRSQLVGKYSDFKSFQLAFKSDTPELQRELQAMLERANARFADVISETVSPEYLAGQELRGIAADPSNWFLAGSGRTLDEAASGSRQGRSAFGAANGSVRPTVRRYEDIREQVQRHVDNLETHRQSMLNSLPQNSPLLVNTPKGKTLSASLIDVIRKTKVDPKTPGAPRNDAEFFQALRTRINDRFGVALNEEQLRAIKQYLNTSDNLPANLLIPCNGRGPDPCSDVPDLLTARHGVVLTDFTGAGSMERALLLENMIGVRTADEALIVARRTEQQMTDYMDTLRPRTGDVFESTMNAGSRQRAAYGASGDDALGVPTRAVTDQEKLDYLETLSNQLRNSPSPSVTGVRVAARASFVPETTLRGVRIPTTQLRNWGNIANNLEKELRAALIKSSVASDTLERVGLGIDLRPALSTVGRNRPLLNSQVRVIMSGRVSTVELNRIRDVIERELRQRGVTISPTTCLILAAPLVRNGPARCITPRAAPASSSLYFNSLKPGQFLTSQVEIKNTLKRISHGQSQAVLW